MQIEESAKYKSITIGIANADIPTQVVADMLL